MNYGKLIESSDANGSVSNGNGLPVGRGAAVRESLSSTSNGGGTPSTARLHSNYQSPLHKNQHRSIVILENPNSHYSQAIYMVSILVFQV